MQIIDRVTSATAKRMRDAGFKQPPPAPGQVWFNRFGLAYFVGTRPDGRLCFISSQGGSFDWPHDCWNFTYAATATDIMRDLGEDYALVYIDGEPRIISTVEKRFPVLYKHATNPAEPAAICWVEKSKHVQP